MIIIVQLVSSEAIVAGVQPHQLKVRTPWGLSATILSLPGVRVVGFSPHKGFSHSPFSPNIMEYKPPTLPLQFFSPSGGATLYDVIRAVSAGGLGLDGSNITVGIVDTGVDFSTPGLGLDVVARTPDGVPMLFDADELGLAITPLNVTINPYTKKLNTSGSEIEVYVPGAGIATVTVDFDWIAPQVTSKSGFYKFGFLVEYSFSGNSLLGGNYLSIGYLIPIVLVDSKTPGVYDTLVPDLSSTWFTLAGFYYALGLIPTPPSQSLIDYSFSDEKPLTIGNGTGAIDADGDGIPDFSIGVISGYVYDAYGIINSTGYGGSYSWKNAWEPLGSGVYPGLDPNGGYVSLFYDPIGHGTSVAYIIGGRKATFFIPTTTGLKKIEERGIAPHVKLAASMGVFNGNVLASLYWLAGFDYVNGTWIYTGNHKSDLISNSWGVIYWQNLLLENGNGFVPGNDPLSYHLSRIANRTLIIFAAGNEGPARESIAMGGATPWVITVGASTLNSTPLYDSYGHLLLPRVLGDNIISWSSVGPTPTGFFKPDAVAPGAYALVPTAIMNGLGDGVRAVDIFGGTSMATPVVSGSLSLVLQFLRAKGIDYNSSYVKKLLENYSDDLGYPPGIEGYGRINVSKIIRGINSTQCCKTPLYITGIVRDNEMMSPTSLPDNASIILTMEKIVFQAENYTVDGFARQIVNISIPSQKFSYLKVRLIVNGVFNNSLPLSVVVLGGWIDKNNDSKFSVNELVMCDHNIIGGRDTVLRVTRNLIDLLEKLNGVHNNSIVLYIHNLGPSSVSFNITVDAVWRETLPLSGKMSEERLIKELDGTYGIRIYTIIAGEKRVPIVLRKELMLPRSYLEANITSISVSHSGFFGGLGDLLTIPVSLEFKRGEGAHRPSNQDRLLGYIVTVDNRDVDVYVSRRQSSYYNLEHIVSAYATHPLGVLPAPYPYYPLEKPAPPRLFISSSMLDGSTKLYFYVVDDKGENGIKVSFYPVYYSLIRSGGNLYLSLNSSFPLGEIFLPDGRMVFHNGGVLYEVFPAYYNATISLRNFYGIGFYSQWNEGMVTTSNIGGPVTISLHTEKTLSWNIMPS